MLSSASQRCTFLSCCLQLARVSCLCSSAEMLWSEGHDWAVSLSLPLGSYDFKCVVVHSNGSAGEWEDGPNRSFEVCLFSVQFLLIFKVAVCISGMPNCTAPLSACNAVVQKSTAWGMHAHLISASWGFICLAI